jgi:hypothetical protein
MATWMIDVLREVAALGIVTVVLPLGLWLLCRLAAAVWRALRAL